MSVTRRVSFAYRVPLWAYRRAALAAAVLLAGLLIAAQGHQRGSGPPSPAPALVVRGHTQAVAAVLAAKVGLRGTLYPALPGVNTLRLRVTGARSMDTGVPGLLTLRLLMPGMAMRPISVTLHEQAGQYRDTIVLPMFGAYIAHVLLATPHGHWHGTLRLDMPLDPSH